MNVGLCTSRRAAHRARSHAGAIGTFAVGLACAALLVAPSGTALAEADVLIEVGVNGQVEFGDQALVHVTITADELIDGEIVVSMENVGISVRQDVQIAAGTTKEFYFALPTTWDAPSVQVSVRDDGNEIANENQRARQSDGDELVGVLPRLASRLGELPGGVPLADGLAEAQVAAVPVEVIDLGVAALRAYDTIFAGGDDVSSLTDEQRETLFAWVSVGGILLLDDGVAAVDLPEAWQPGPSGYAWAGLGEVRITDGAAMSGEWADVVPPTMMGTSGMFMGSEMMMDPQMELASRSGLDLPSIAPLTIGIGAYALVLGPIVYLVLRKMRRLTLGWFVIPALAVLTAGGVAVAGGGALRNGNPAGATYIEQSPAGSYAFGNVLTFSSQGGSSDLTIPARWSLAQSPNMFWGDGGQPIPITISRQADGSSEASVSLEATQANVRSYAGTTRSDGLTTTAALTSDGPNNQITLTGTVTNHADITFHDVAVFAGDDEAYIGDIAPGESAEWTMSAARELEMLWEPRGAAVWGDPWAAGGEFMAAPGRVVAAVGTAEEAPADLEPEEGSRPGESVEYGLWGMANQDVEMFPSGMVRVVGWTDEIPNNVLDDPDASALTAVGSVTPVASDGNRVNAATVRAASVRSPFGGPVAPQGNQQFARYLLPAGADSEALFLTGHDDLHMEEIAFWNGSEWVEADAENPVVPVPGEAIRAGSILVRTDVDMNTGTMGIPTLTDEAPEEP